MTVDVQAIVTNIEQAEGSKLGLGPDEIALLQSGFDTVSSLLDLHLALCPDKHTFNDIGLIE